MPERLTPEQFQKLIYDFAYDGGDTVGILTALEQARNQARTLARVRALLERRPHENHIIWSSVKDKVCPCFRCQVAALLRAEED